MPGDVSLLEPDVVVYVDGACKNNGQADPKGGCGVFWGDDHELNCSESLLGERQTNNRAEMSAAVIALSQAIDLKIEKLTIVSDSRYLKEGISNWIKTWKLNGWKTDKKTGILNKDLWVLLDGLQKKLEVTWRWVEGHSTSEGNNRADTLAGVGVGESSCFWQQRALDIVSVPILFPEPSIQSKVEEINVCSFCNKDSSEKTIICTDCKSVCHYSCTRLPRYQLYAFANRHRKFSCEKCLSVPVSFASEIDDEVSVGNTVLAGTTSVDNPKEVPACPVQLSDVLSKHTESLQKMFETFQSNTVHSLEVSFVSAIEKLSRMQSTQSNMDQQAQINQLLQDKDKLMREKDNLQKQRKHEPQEETSHTVTMKTEIQALTRQLEKCKQEKDNLQERLHNSVTDYEIQKSKLDLDTTVLRQKLDVMSSRNEILTNELSRLEKIAAMKNDDVLALENDKRDLKRKIDQLEVDILSWKSHASRADDSLLVGSTENSPVIISDSETGSNTYSAAASARINVTQHSATSTSDHQRTSGAESATFSLADKSKGNNAAANNLNVSATESASKKGKHSTQPNTNEVNRTESVKDTVLLIGTSNVRFLSTRYIAGERYYVRKVIKYTVSEATEYIGSLEINEKVSKFLLHLSCNDIKSLSATDHATAYCNLVNLIKEKYPSAQVIVSLGLPCKDPKIYNKLEIANAMIKERLFGVQGIRLCDNSNLSYRGKPAHGMLEDDGVHVSRRGVYTLNNNFRSCIYNTGGESESRGLRSRGGNYRKFGGHRSTGYRAGFSNDRSRR